jgi:YD repeat-containing protein
MRKALARLRSGVALAVIASLASAGASFAQTANSYTYDSLGRLKTATIHASAGDTVITYTYDSAGNRTQQVTTVNSTNHAPVANTDTVATAINAAVTFDPLANDTDADYDALTITAKTNGSHGTVAINSGATLTYTPTTGYTGSDSFTYTVSDGSATATGTVNMTVSTGPVAVADTIHTTPSTAYTFDPRSNDTDAAGYTLTVTGKTNGTNGFVAINGTGTGVTYTPNSGYTGNDSFTYTVTDGHGGSGTATVTATISASPTATTDTITAVQGIAKTFDPRTNDTDPQSYALTVSGVGSPSHGSTSSTATSVTYTATSTYTGSDSFTYTISNGYGGTATGTVNATVVAYTNPTAVNDSATAQAIYPGGSCVTPQVTFDPRTNDTNPSGLPLTIVSKTNGTKGTVTTNGTTLTYTFSTPKCSQFFTTTDSFTYTINDGHGSNSTATVSMTIEVDGLQ